MATALLGRPRARRLRKRAEFVRVQSAGARVSAPRLLFLLMPGEPGAASRLGITASRKVGGAVVRNRAKRLIREAFRLHPELTPPGVDLVVIVRRDLGALGLAGVVDEWRAVTRFLFRRAAPLPAGATGPQAPHGPGREPGGGSRS